MTLKPEAPVNKIAGWLTSHLPANKKIRQHSYRLGKMSQFSGQRLASAAIYVLEETAHFFDVFISEFNKGRRCTVKPPPCEDVGISQRLHVFKIAVKWLLPVFLHAHISMTYVVLMTEIMVQPCSRMLASARLTQLIAVALSHALHSF